MALLEPKDETIKTLAGIDKTYVLSKFPAIAGREIVANYPLTAVPKAGDYAANESIMLKLMCYVGVQLHNKEILPLTTRDLVNNHVPDYETLVKLEIAMLKYNTSFFTNGLASNFLNDTLEKLIVSISPTLTGLSARLLERVKQRIENSKQNTP